MDFVFFITLLITFILLGRIVYYFYVDNGVSTQKELKTVKTLIFLGSGGHTSEMLKIVQNLDIDKYTPRVYIHGALDVMSYVKLQRFEKTNEDFTVHTITRSREVGQSYFTSVITSFIALCRDKMDMAPLTTAEIAWDSFLPDCSHQLHREIQVHVVPLSRSLYAYLEKNEKPSHEWVERKLLRLEACLDRIWESLNTGYWRHVPEKTKYSYTICCVLKSIVLELEYRCKSIAKKENLMVIAQQIDKGILLGAPLQNTPRLLTNIASRIHKCIFSEDIINADNSLECTVNHESIKTPFNCKWIERHKIPSMQTFYCKMFKSKTPGLLEDCINHWKALQLWKDPNYLMNLAGMRTVPIEIGLYTDENWSQQLLTLNDFFHSHITRVADTVGYLAQHQLFEQIPELKEDFSIPEYCSFVDGPDNCSPEINAWYGPKGTISPLHYDPKNNLLCQVFGYKRIILYHPDHSENLYPHQTKLLHNTSQVDPANVDYKKFPNFKKAEGLMCLLGPGEVLYIPPGWWHYVTSLSYSFSISFWWK